MRIKLALLLISSLSVSLYVKAQNNLITNDANITIKNLVENRIGFNKTLIKSREIQIANLPKPQYIFNQPGSHTVNFENLNFSIENKKIVSIAEIPLSKAALNIINERLIVLDKMQYAYSESSNLEYLSGEKDRRVAFNNDRQFFSVLKSLKSTITEISTLAKADDQKASVENALAKWKQPHIDWQFFSQIVVKETQFTLGK
ncbi:hypothetical protein GJU39_01150 [Pedobacter petrophilus]|uniref:DUF4230 domain-containing protein n=1 Tax=Pedobacter petrophilus TaxID=1908241 RepID=A0A7K0FTW9_9SPHI|nr:hypothetical protein [Pedobacter petrophilus]MRX74680.1 hypothetical protein [Pedobacter petrophilus]